MLPSLTDRALGGPLGAHASPTGRWRRPDAWAFGLATLSWLILMARQQACVADPGLQYKAACYSDVAALWGPRGIDRGLVPYLEVDLEYPVLTGGFIHLTRLASGLLPGTPSVAFLGLTAVLLFGCFLGLVAVHLRLSGWGALFVAASPLVIAGGLINWDLLVVLLTSAALLAWARGRPALTGVLIGLGTAAKLYPVLLLVPIVVLALRAARLQDAARAVGGAVLAWLAVNVPVYLAAPAGWLNFWTFNSDRGADLGSLWFVLEGLGFPVSRLSAVMAVLVVLGVALVAALLLMAPRRPRLAQGAFLVVLVFCLVNKVYSPQYMLWLLPLFALARPVWRDWIVFTASELFYWGAVWLYLDSALFAGDGSPRAYWVAILVRVGVQVWCGARVVRDILDPTAEPGGTPWPAV